MLFPFQCRTPPQTIQQMEFSDDEAERAAKRYGVQMCALLWLVVSTEYDEQIFWAF